MGHGFSLPELTQRLFMLGGNLIPASITGSVDTGSATGQVVINVDTIDGGDAATNGDGLGDVLSIRYRTIDGIWNTLPDTVVGAYTVDLPEAFEGLVVNVWVQVQGTAGFGQTFVDSVGVPGTHVDLEEVVDSTIPVVDAAVPVVDETATTIAPV